MWLNVGSPVCLCFCLPGLCASWNSWRSHSLGTKIMFPPALRDPTWPRSWRSTPRQPLTTITVLTTSLMPTARGPSSPSTTGETHRPKDMMVSLPSLIFPLAYKMERYEDLALINWYWKIRLKYYKNLFCTARPARSISIKKYIIFLVWNEARVLIKALVWFFYSQS